MSQTGTPAFVRKVFACCRANYLLATNEYPLKNMGRVFVCGRIPSQKRGANIHPVDEYPLKTMGRIFVPRTNTVPSQNLGRVFVRGTNTVMVRPWKAGNYLKILNFSVFVLFGWRFVFGIIMRWEGREPVSSRCHRAVSLLLSFAKVSNTKDMLYRQTYLGILCRVHLVT